MARGVAGLTGVAGLKGFALATKGSGLRHVQILCQVLMEIIVPEITQKMNLDLVSSDCYDKAGLH